jgi:phage-related protein
MNGVRHRRYWRLYRTAGERRVILEELHRLPIDDYANIRSAMLEVVKHGLRAAKSLRNEILEIDADGEHGVTYRLLFATDGHHLQMLLALVLFNKKSQKTPQRLIDLAEARLRDWRSRRIALT